MKKVKIMLTAVTVLAVTGSALAFKAHKAYDGSYICRALGTGEGVCPEDVPANKFKINQAGQFHFCNNGAGSTNCDNQLKVLQDDN